MRYGTIVPARFVSRPNRFIAVVKLPEEEPATAVRTCENEISGVEVVREDRAGDSGFSDPASEDIVWREERVHVKNTGRGKELLLPDARLILEKSDNPNRKTQYDLIAVYKEGLGLVNIDSQAPNKVVKEWLETQGYDSIRPEFTYGGSRFDFYMEKGEEKHLMEVKGCTLEIGGIGYFPDAPTERGVKHLRELAEASKKGYICHVAFVIQMEGVDRVLPNVETHPEFGTALAEAQAAGVRVLCLGCRVREEEMVIDRVLEI